VTGGALAGSAGCGRARRCSVQVPFGGPDFGGAGLLHYRMAPPDSSSGLVGEHARPPLSTRYGKDWSLLHKMWGRSVMQVGGRAQREKGRRCGCGMGGSGALDARIMNRPAVDRRALATQPTSRMISGFQQSGDRPAHRNRPPRSPGRGGRVRSRAGSEYRRRSFAPGPSPRRDSSRQGPLPFP
jgi:hypothetical protein